MNISPEAEKLIASELVDNTVGFLATKYGYTYHVVKMINQKYKIRTNSSRHGWSRKRILGTKKK